MPRPYGLTLGEGVYGGSRYGPGVGGLGITDSSGSGLDYATSNLSLATAPLTSGGGYLDDFNAPILTYGTVSTTPVSTFMSTYGGMLLAVGAGLLVLVMFKKR